MLALLIIGSVAVAESLDLPEDSLSLARVGWSAERARRRRPALDRKRYRDQQKWGWTGCAIGFVGMGLAPFGILMTDSPVISSSFWGFTMSSGRSPLADPILAVSGVALAIGAPIAIGHGIGSANVLDEARRPVSKVPAIAGGVLYGATPVLFAVGLATETPAVTWTAVGTLTGSYGLAIGQLLHNKAIRTKRRR